MSDLISLQTATLIWISLPFLIGFSIYLLPKLARPLGLVMALLSLGYSLPLLGRSSALSMHLVDSFGVTLQVDSLSGYFVLTNALVTAAVLAYCWSSNKGSFFYTQAMILHGSVNAVFICADFINLYVALEVIGVASFLLITHARSDRSIWVGLRYLFVSNTAMLFYLMGAVLLYQSSGTFAFTGLAQAPPEAIALMALGLVTKGGIFVSGLWLPLTHSEAETPVSAMLSGVVVKTGVFPLVRCALLFPELQPLLGILGMGTALLGVGYAMFEKDAKRMLAFHTVSQLGFVLAAPAVGGFYALTHGLVKSALFLGAGQLPNRNFKLLQKQSIPAGLWAVLAIAALSISGLPLLAGFGAKTLTLKTIQPWQVMGMNLAALGTAISFAKFIFLPHGNSNETKHSDEAETDGTLSKSIDNPGFWIAMAILLGGLVLANGFYLEAYSLISMAKAIVTLGAGWLIYWLVIRRVPLKFPRVIEQFDNLIGTMSLMLTLLFWMVLA